LFNQFNLSFSIESLIEDLNQAMIVMHRVYESDYEANETTEGTEISLTDIKRITELATKLRKTLCNKENVKQLKSNSKLNVFYKLVIENKIPGLINNRRLIYECLWGLNNLSSIKNVELKKFVKQTNLVAKLKRLIFSNTNTNSICKNNDSNNNYANINEDEQILEEIMYCIGNFSLSSIELRNQTINLGILNIIIELLKNNNIMLELQRACIWCISQLCRGDPEPDSNKVIHISLYLYNHL